ncbi:hypothetical protein C8Q80DRAFT_1119841 [Daedaleopsis nitida]|nr:hypothetical protein C8Q80DRAFT_1119841 [Daedaleopsis nitida]
MPRIRHRIDTAQAGDAGYQWPERSEPSHIEWNIGSFSDVNIPGPPPPSITFPDVPLNPQHRFCTPPPLDPRFIDRYEPHDDFPQYTSRPPSPEDFDELMGARPPLPAHPGSQGNPFVLDDDTRTPQARPSKRRQPPDYSDPSSERRAVRSSPRTTKTTTPASSSSLSRTTSSSRASGSSRTPIPVTSTLRGQLEPARKTKASKSSTSPKTRGQGRKTAANGYSPSKPSPLSQVVYRAPSEQPPAPGPSGYYRACSVSSMPSESESESSDSDY